MNQDLTLRHKVIMKIMRTTLLAYFSGEMTKKRGRDGKRLLILL